MIECSTFVVHAMKMYKVPHPVPNHSYLVPVI